MRLNIVNPRTNESIQFTNKGFLNFHITFMDIATDYGEELDWSCPGMHHLVTKEPNDIIRYHVCDHIAAELQTILHTMDERIDNNPNWKEAATNLQKMCSDAAEQMINLELQ